MRSPDSSGGGLVNLVAELEHRLTGTAASPRLRPDLRERIPDARSYLLVLFDGLGDEQLDDPDAGSLAAARRGAVDAPFPTTTTVSLATVATGRSPRAHGLIAYQLWLPDLEVVVNTIKWTLLWGEPVAIPTDRFLPAPNLWERLRAGGAEPITVQPGNFAGSPLSRMLYRGARFEPVYTAREMIDAALDLVAQPGRLVFVYLPHLDFAAHTHGRDSDEYRDAMRFVASAWEQLVAGRPTGAALVGTADHGVVEVPLSEQYRIPDPLHQGVVLYGDSRAMFVRGGREAIDRLVDEVPAAWVPVEDMAGWWGNDPPHPDFAARRPDGALLAGPGAGLLHRHSDKRLVGHHGGLSEAELRVPVLVV